MIIACGSDSSFSMHSLTTRRAIRFVEATRGITASDSRVFRRGTIARVSSWNMRSLILLQFLDLRPQFCLAVLSLLHDLRRCVADELFVCQLRVEGRELFLALLEIALRPLDLFLGNDFF